MVKCRFAPSPTGLIHLGNVRTALFNVLFAKSNAGKFLLRIEDTDNERSKAEFVEALKEDLLWLGLEWEEGPDAENIKNAFFQSQRTELYDGYFSQLLAEGLAYPCFCSAEQLESSRKRQLAEGKPPRYAGTCAHLNDKEVQEREKTGIKATLRFRVPVNDTIAFSDMVKGLQKFPSRDIGDFIIRKADKGAAFFFCNAVDDALMGVSHVFRGEDHLSNTPRQLMLLQALGLNAPKYGHISMIVGSDGAPLSKRHGSQSIVDLKKSGYMPLAIVNYLARLGHSYSHDNFLSMRQLGEAFEVKRLGKSPAKFDFDQLKRWQTEAVASASDDEFWTWVGDEVKNKVPENKQDRFVSLIKNNVLLPDEVTQWTSILFEETIKFDDQCKQLFDEAGSRFFEKVGQSMATYPHDFKTMINNIKDETGKRGKSLFMPLRAALTGRTDGPELAGILSLMDPDISKNRIKCFYN